MLPVTCAIIQTSRLRSGSGEKKNVSVRFSRTRQAHCVSFLLGFRARTQNTVYVHKILCRIRRSWRGATIDGDTESLESLSGQRA